METYKLAVKFFVYFSSYRTYEEWKRFEGVYDTIESDGFLPYLWGMETIEDEQVFCRFFQRSYRTYEEWKLS